MGENREGELRLQIEYKHRCHLWKPPRMKRVFWKRIKNHGIRNEDWGEIWLPRFNEVLADCYVPIWVWLIGVLCFGLFGWIVIPIQFRKTRRQAIRLKELLGELNEKCRKWEQDNNHKNECLRFELPLPSVPGVLLNAVFYKEEAE